MLTPSIRALDNSNNTLSNDDNSITKNHHCQQTHTLHQMSALEAEHRPDVCKGKGKNDLDASEDVPRDEDATIARPEAECDAQVDHGHDDVHADLHQHRETLLLVLADVPEDACIFDS